MDGKPLDLAAVKELLEPTPNTSNGFMLLKDGSKVPFDSTRCGVFVGKAGTPRKLIPPDSEVIAYVARIGY